MLGQSAYQFIRHRPSPATWTMGVSITMMLEI